MGWESVSRPRLCRLGHQTSTQSVQFVVYVVKSYIRGRGANGRLCPSEWRGSDVLAPLRLSTSDLALLAASRGGGLVTVKVSGLRGLLETDSSSSGLQASRSSQLS